MNEITRRLYTKPVIVLSLLAGMVLLAGLFATAKSRAAAPTYIPAGDDRFETTDNGETYHNFAGAPIPAGFFNTDGAATSQKYSGLVPLVGVPLPGEGDTDTIIRRNQSVSPPGTTSIQIVALSLGSINPITVTYSDRPSEAWSMRVSLSDNHTSTGAMSIGASTFDSSLGVYPKFTFTRLSDGAVKVLDTGGGSGLAAPSRSSLQVGEATQIEPGPAPMPVPCHVQVVPIDQFEVQAKAGASAAATSAVAVGNCAPVTLTSNNCPWQICANGGFCIPRPITEQELLASHNASPPGTKKGGIIR